MLVGSMGDPQLGQVCDIAPPPRNIRLVRFIIFNGLAATRAISRAISEGLLINATISRNMLVAIAGTVLRPCIIASVISGVALLVDDAIIRSAVRSASAMMVSIG